MSEKETNEFDKYQIYLVKELERLNTNYESLTEQMQNMREDIASLKVKSGLWGSISAIVIIVLGILLKIISIKGI